MIIIGNHESGKSFLIKDILSHQNFSDGTIIASTDNNRQFYNEFVPPEKVHGEFSSELTSEVMNRINEKIRENNMWVPNFLVMDDCPHNKVMTDITIRQFFLFTRHKNTTVITTMKHTDRIPLRVRMNTDYYFIFHETDPNVLMQIYDQLPDVFPSFESFCEAMEECTKDYGCLVIDDNCHYDRPKEQVYWYRAEPRPDLRLCVPEGLDNN